MRKAIMGIIMAVTLVGSSLAFPVQAYADYIPENSDSIFNDSDDIIGNNHGTVVMNFGTVESNNSGGTVDNNYGTVGTNYGTVEINSQGTVKNNFEKVVNNFDRVEKNDGGTVENNFGRVENNYGGTVVNNFDRIEKNDGGTVVNNFGGDVNGGTVTNQWYEYILTGGSFKSGSTSSKGADNRTWIGKANEEDVNLGYYYITVAANEGTVFESATLKGQPIEYIINEDGTISFGNISSAISILFKQPTNNNNNNNDDEDTGNTYESSADSNAANLVAAIEAVVATEEKMPVALFTSDEAVAKIPEAAKNSGASYNLSAITTSQGFVAAVNKISENAKVQNAVNNATNNNTARRTSVTVYSDKPMNFTADILNAISASDIDFVFVFMHNGKMYRVTIPRGTVIDFSGHVYEGPLFIGQILGTTEEIG